MNKARVDSWILQAMHLLDDLKITEDGQIEKGYSAQIAAFGAAVQTGSLLAAVSFFSSQGESDYKRDRLMYAIHLLIKGEDAPADTNLNVTQRRALFYDLVAKSITREEVLDAAVALKLAMKLFRIAKSSRTTEEDQEMQADGCQL